MIRFDQILKSGIWVIDAENNTLFVNPSMAKILGYTPEEMQGKPLFFFMDERGIEISKKNIQRRHQGIKEQHEFAFLHKDGRRIYTTIETSPIMDEDGNYQGAIAGVMDITERKITEDALRESEKRYRQLYEEAPAMIHSIDRDGKLLMVSKYWLEVMGYEREEVIGRNTTDFLTEESKKMAQNVYLPKFFSAGNIKNVPYQKVKKNGAIMDVLLSAISEKDKNGNITRMFAVIVDVSEQKQAEEQLRTSLREKEILLQELYHRTKNNMQTIVSMINLQTQHIADKQTLQRFRETKNRISSMSLVHEKLYQGKSLSKIDLKAYFTDLIHLLTSSYEGMAEKVRITIDMETVFVTIDSAIPCGLILNELISNVFKHAFPEQREREMSLRLRMNADQEIEILFGDNGVGLPDTINIRKVETLGLQTIVALAEYQLPGKVNVFRDNGTQFHIKFKEPSYKERV